MFFKENCFEKARENSAYRNVVFTTNNSQLVLMTLEPHDEIPEEQHKVDQIFIFVSGSGEALLNGISVTFKAYDTLIVPAGTMHVIRNTESEALKLFTFYAPPQHPAQTYQQTRELDEYE